MTHDSRRREKEKRTHDALIKTNDARRTTHNNGNNYFELKFLITKLD